ncbi:MAG: DEAD/DEAH box helicase [Paludibacteraceae bacterium]|nr:DEAD/DEAH box helicase [Paludibacteraceae bacterium]
MNYLNFYKDAEQQLIEAMTTLWVPGHPKEIEHLKNLFEKREPIMAEPEFQTIFPWESSSENFEEHSSKLKLFDNKFVEALASISDDDYKEYNFPLDRKPYKHQTDSWKSMLKDKKTIVVTTGTGSGKTECFMLPVIQDLYDQRKKGIKEGIQAIFLYPLNALMKNQQKRIHAWCKSLDAQVTYGIYNGETEKDRLRTAEAKKRYPQICSRTEIQETPPQILFTNPTMLNYMLVRAEDQKIMNVVKESRGKLRWILLDEAHTYTGSAAADLALQIRQVIDAFGVSIDEVNFALTSATIGESGNDEAIKQLKENVSKLTGKPVDDIVVIDGKRIIPELDETIVKQELDNINNEFGTRVSVKDLKALRKDLNEKPCLNCQQITNRFHTGWDRYQQLAFIDALGVKRDSLDKQALLPSRAHFFIRTINGIYSCLNPNCETAREGSTEVGALTSYQSMECPHCHMPLLEVGTCSDCGGLLLIGEYNTNEGLRMRVNTQVLENLSFYTSDDEDDEDDNDKQKASSNKFVFFVMGHDEKPVPKSDVEGNDVVLDIENRKIRRANENDDKSVIFREIIDKQRRNELCPHCATGVGNKIQYFRGSANFMSRIISPVLLNNADKSDSVDSNTLFEGRKYIAFTDSRQGTAKSAMQQNLDVERRWIRSSIFHKLAERRRDSIPPTTMSEEEKEKLKYFSSLVAQGQPIPGFFQKEYEELCNKANGVSIVPPAEIYYWSSIEDPLMIDKDFAKLAHHMDDARKRSVSNGRVSETTKRDYLRALFLDQFGWIPKNGNTLETLGFVHLVYPALKNARVPATLAREGGFSDADWQTYLKICIDYFIRASRCIAISDSIKPYLQQSVFTREVYASDSTLEKVLKWPVLESTGTRIEEKQKRIVLILCAALGVTDFKSISTEKRNAINEALQEAWNFLKDNVLTETDHENHGYKLDLINESKVGIQLMTEGWLCPVNSVIVDTIIKGYSPRLKGFINANNFERYKVTDEKISFPYYPYAYKINKKDNGVSENISDENIKQWTKENWQPLYNHGLYRQIHFGVLQNMPIYIAGEHSAQQQKEVLEKYEKDFNSGRMNILSCSTTMEMGVDLKGISEVVMNTVPPKPANYLQRAGRAGRRNESKAMAVTFCAPTPVAMNAWKNPSWPMTDKTQMPQIKLESTQIVQRHINSLLFAKFVVSEGGMKITASVGDFFSDQTLLSEHFRQQLERWAYNGDIEQEMVNAYQALVKGTIMATTSIHQAATRTISDLNLVQKVYTDRMEVLKDALDHATKDKAKVVLNKKITHYKNQNILTFFAENNFLPTSGIPTGLVEFMPENDPFDKNGNKKVPTQHISQAIANYAPGKQVVINEWCYESSGIALKTKYDETKKNILQSCDQCGYTTIVFGTPLHDCPKCHARNCMQGVQGMSIGTQTYFTEIVEPAAFGVHYNYEPKRTMRPKSSLEQIQPVLLNMEPWPKKNESALFTMRCSTPKSEILVYNKGNGAGYAYCPYCGEMVTEKTIVGGSNDKKPLEFHSHFETGGPCDGSGKDGSPIHRNVLLVGHYQTDFVELKFYDKNQREITDEATLYSLGVIISRKLTEVLGVNEGEIDFGYCASYHSIFIYDTAIGGAGYSILLRDYKAIVLDECVKALESCQCSTACTHCLIDKRSQWYINYLDRNKALDWLKFEQTTRVANENIRRHFSDANIVTSDLQTEIYSDTRSDNLKDITIFIDADIEHWIPSSFPIRKRLDELKVKGVNVKYVMDKNINPSNISAEQQAALMSILFKEQLYVGQMNSTQMKPLMVIEHLDGNRQMYFGEDIKRGFNNTWGYGSVYTTRQVPNITATAIDPTQIFAGMNSSNGNYAFEQYLAKTGIQAESIFDILLSENKDNWMHIKQTMNEKEVNIEYSDKYILTPIDVYILARFIEKVKEEFQLKIKSVLIQYGGDLSTSDGNLYETLPLKYKFNDQVARTKFTKFCFKEFVDIDPIVTTYYEEHSRPMVFDSSDYQLVIRPDAGIAHAWTVDRSQENLTIGDIENYPDEPVPLYSYNWNYQTKTFKNQGELFLTILKKK